MSTSSLSNIKKKVTPSYVRKAEVLLLSLIYDEIALSKLTKIISTCENSNPSSVRRSLYRVIPTLKKLWLIEENAPNVFTITPLGLYVTYHLFGVFGATPYLVSRQISRKVPFLKGFDVVIFLYGESDESSGLIRTAKIDDITFTVDTRRGELLVDGNICNIIRNLHTIEMEYRILSYTSITSLLYEICKQTDSIICDPLFDRNIAEEGIGVIVKALIENRWLEGYNIGTYIYDFMPTDRDIIGRIEFHPEYYGLTEDQITPHTLFLTALSDIIWETIIDVEDKPFVLINILKNYGELLSPFMCSLLIDELKYRYLFKLSKMMESLIDVSNKYPEILEFEEYEAEEIKKKLLLLVNNIKKR